MYNTVFTVNGRIVLLKEIRKPMNHERDTKKPKLVTFDYGGVIEVCPYHFKLLK